MIKRFINYITGIGKEMNKRNMPSFAASVAFYFFLALIPLLMFTFSLIANIDFLKEEFLFNIVYDIIPKSIQGKAISFINDINKASKSVLPITALVTLWTAGMGIMGLIRGLNGVLGFEEKRNYFVLRGIAALYTLLLLIVVFVSSGLIIFGQLIAEFCMSIWPKTVYFFNILLPLRGFLVWGILTVVLDMAYVFLPAQRQKIILQLPGAIIAAGLWCLATLAFSVYVDYFHGFSIYGSLTMLMVLLFWLNLCFNILMFGAFINTYYKPFFVVSFSYAKKLHDAKK